MDRHGPAALAMTIKKGGPRDDEKKSGPRDDGGIGAWHASPSLRARGAGVAIHAFCPSQRPMDRHCAGRLAI